jgi:hypothetical protein
VLVTIQSKIKKKNPVVEIIMEMISLQWRGSSGVKRASGWKLSAAYQIIFLTLCLEHVKIVQKAPV